MTRQLWAALLLVGSLACHGRDEPQAARSGEFPPLPDRASSPASPETVAAREAAEAARIRVQEGERAVKELGARPPNGSAALGEWDRAVLQRMPGLQAAQRERVEAERRVEAAEFKDFVEAVRASGLRLVVPEVCEEYLQRYALDHPQGSVGWPDPLVIRIAMYARLSGGEKWEAVEADCRAGWRQ